MSGISESYVDRGYTPLMDAGNIGMGFQGVRIKDLWMWTGKCTEFADGSKMIKTSKVTDLKEAALHIFKDGWIPVEPLSDETLRSMENALRGHRGLTNVPAGPFLTNREIPSELLMPGADVSDKVVKGVMSEEALKAFRVSKGG